MMDLYTIPSSSSLKLSEEFIRGLVTSLLENLNQFLDVFGLSFLFRSTLNFVPSIPFGFAHKVEKTWTFCINIADGSLLVIRVEIELVVLGRLDGAVLGKTLDDLYSLLELGFRHGGSSTRGSE